MGKKYYDSEEECRKIFDSPGTKVFTDASEDNPKTLNEVYEEWKFDTGRTTADDYDWSESTNSNDDD